MDRQGILDYLKSRNIRLELAEHKAVSTMEALSDVVLPYPEADAKNLFVRGDKKRCYYLITVRGDRRVDLQEFRRRHGTRQLSFASETDLKAMLGLMPGAVTPFGLLNDTEHRVEWFLDEAFFSAPGLIGVHPNENTATIWLRTEDLIGVLRGCGCTFHVVPV